MTEAQMLAYVEAAALVAGLQLDAARAGRVAGHLQRTLAMAQLLGQFALTPHDEMAETFHPGQAAILLASPAVEG